MFILNTNINTNIAYLLEIGKIIKNLNCGNILFY